MYQQYPASAPVSQEPARLGPPRSVVRAIRLMYVGAAAELAALVVDLIDTGPLRAGVEKKYPHYSATQLNHVEDARVALLVVAALVAAGLWLWMARANGKGLRWARPVSTVFFGIGLLDIAVQLATVHTVATLIVDGAISLIGLVVIVLLFRKESGPFYRQPRTPRP